MALPKLAYLSIEEIAARGAARCNRGEPVALVALDLVDHADPNEWRSLAAIGLQRTIHARLYAERQYASGLPNEADGADDSAALGTTLGSIRHLLPRQTHPAKDFWMLALVQSYRVGDSRKAVLDFSATDARIAQDTYRNRAYGNFEKADAFGLAAKLLTEHKADTVRQLPKTAQQSIAEALR